MKQNSEVGIEFRCGCLGLCIEGETEVEVKVKVTTKGFKHRAAAT